MSKPRQRDLERLKRLLRYYRGRPRATIQMRRGGDMQQCDVLVDADFAGCPYTRRSTCGGALMWGGSLIKAWSGTLPTIALSSGESELGALTKGAAEGLGLAALLRDFGCEIKPRIKSVRQLLNPRLKCWHQSVWVTLLTFNALFTHQQRRLVHGLELAIPRRFTLGAGWAVRQDTAQDDNDRYVSWGRPKCP